MHNHEADNSNHLPKYLNFFNIVFVVLMIMILANAAFHAKVFFSKDDFTHFTLSRNEPVNTYTKLLTQIRAWRSEGHSVKIVCGPYRQSTFYLNSFYFLYPDIWQFDYYVDAPDSKAVTQIDTETSLQPGDYMIICDKQLNYPDLFTLQDIPQLRTTYSEFNIYLKN